MAKRSRKNIDRVIAIIAGLVLAFGLVPVTASAAGEGPDGPGGQAPNISKTVAAAGPEAPPAPPEKTGDGAAEGDKTEEGGAQDGAGASDGKSEETGDAKAGTPAGGAGENAPGAAPADGGAAGGGKAEAPAEGSGEGAPGAAPADAGGAENQGKPAGQADDPGKAGDPEQAAPAAEDGAAAANVQAAQPTAQAGGVAAGAKAQFPAFRQSKTVGGVTVAVEAEAGAFPEGARLSVASVPSSRTEAAVAPERDDDENVAVSYTFDIKVLGADGAELQPAGGKPVKVSFKAAEVADPNLDVSVYHVSGGEAEELAVSESGTTATATSEGFSYYTVEFTYGDLRYVLPGGGSVPLSDILKEVGLVGEPTDVQVSDSDLFSVSRESGELVVSSHQAFSSKEWMRVTIASKPYEIAVTDDQEGDYTYDVNNPGRPYAYARITGYSGNGGAITIPSELDGVSVREIGIEAFKNKKGITSVTIPEGVVEIFPSAFEGCTSLNSVTIPASVTRIDPHAFSDCTNLGSVTIPAGVKIIGHDAFSGCTQLESVTIPAGVTSIGNGAFLGCSGLTSVTIMSGNTTFGRDVFENCSNLKDVYYAGTEQQWRDAVGGNVVVPDGATVHYPCAVAVSANPPAGGAVSVSPGQSAPACPGGKRWSGTLLTLTATPSGGYVFANWTEAGPSPEGGPSAEGGGQGAGGATQAITENPYTFEVESDRELTANFGPAKPEITGQPGGRLRWTYGDETARTLSVVADDAGYTLSYQWWCASSTGDEEVPGATNSSYTVPSGTRTGAGTCYYYCVVTNTKDGKTASVASGLAEVTVDRAKLTVTTGSAYKPYDGMALTRPDAKITGLVGGETASVEATGSQTDVGSSPNTCSIEWGTAKAQNYTVTEELGTLTVAPGGKCTVTFKDWDGKVLQSVKVPMGETPKFEGATPTRPPDGKYAYEFAGWEPEVAKVTGDATYTAKYTSVPRGTYRAVSGEGSAYVEGSGTPLVFTFERTVDPEAAFAHFAGIEVDGKPVPEKSAAGSVNYTAAPGSVIVKLQPSFLETLPAGAHTIAALFDDGDPASAGFTVSAPAVHTVAFDANGHGKAPGAQEVEHGGKAKKPANPTADGWTFGGWYTDKACKEAYDFSKPVTADLTLYAKWTKKSSSGTSGTSPKTGDPLAGAFAVALALAAASALALAASRRRNRG